MKALLASTALAAALLVPAVGIAQERAMLLDPASVSPAGLPGRTMLIAGQDDPGDVVSAAQWNDVAEIEDVVVGADGRVEAVIAEFGGFLGMGERAVAIDLSRLVMVGTPDDYVIVARTTRDELMGAPEYAGAYDGAAVLGRTEHVEATVYEGTGQTTASGVDVIENREGAPVTPFNDNVTEGTTTNVAELDEGTVVDNPQTPATAVIRGGGARTTTAGADTGAVDREDTVVQEAMRDDGTITMNGDTVLAESGSFEESPMAGDAEFATRDGVIRQGTDGMIVDNGAIDTGGAPLVTTDPLPSDVAGAVVERGEPATLTAESTGVAVENDAIGRVTEAQSDLALAAPVVERPGYATLAMDDPDRLRLDGVEVFGLGDDRIGEIGGMVAASGMGHPLAILDVGGFLGLGERAVAVPSDSLTILRDETGEVRAYIDATEEQLEALPEYEG